MARLKGRIKCLLACGIAFAFALTAHMDAGCLTLGRTAYGDPPPWAPAHGHRAKYKYRYYPSIQVYFDVARGVYYYPSGSIWRSAVRLPGTLAVSLGDFVTLEMGTPRPYYYHPHVIRTYPVPVLPGAPYPPPPAVVHPLPAPPPAVHHPPKKVWKERKKAEKRAEKARREHEKERHEHEKRVAEKHGEKQFEDREFDRHKHHKD
jgi:hypothetical protein